MNKLYANWTAPSNVSALTTLRLDGFSKPPYDNNLALHVEDDRTDVLANRQKLCTELELSREPAWLEQIHSNLCVTIEEETNRTVDAAITRIPNQPLAILTADCLPIVLCNQAGDEIAAIHAGWKGLVNGIIENTLAKMHSSPSQLMAWIGPAICQRCYETGDEVFQKYMQNYPFSFPNFQAKGEKWHANLAKIAEQILNNIGVKSVYQSNVCTYEQKNDYFSYRRASQTGRMATLIWFNETRNN